MNRTLGRIAFEIFHQALNELCDWDTLPIKYKVAWNEMAISIQYAHNFLTIQPPPPPPLTEEVSSTFKAQGGGTG